MRSPSRKVPEIRPAPPLNRRCGMPETSNVHVAARSRREELGNCKVGRTIRREFSFQRIGEDQLADYAERRGVSLDQARRWLRPNLD